MPLDRVDLSKYRSDVFIETGTHRGDGVRRALEAGFESVMTCELDPSWLMRMPREFITHERVRIGVGRSSRILTDYCMMAGGESVTFWLDAHPDGKLVFETSPLFEELETIKGWEESLADITILIDDMRLFSADDQQRIEDTVLDIRSDSCAISRINGHCANDILVGQM